MNVKLKRKYNIKIWMHQSQQFGPFHQLLLVICDVRNVRLHLCISIYLRKI